jgi:hypothetical protein
VVAQRQQLEFHNPAFHSIELDGSSQSGFVAAAGIVATWGGGQQRGTIEA